MEVTRNEKGRCVTTAPFDSTSECDDQPWQDRSRFARSVLLARSAPAALAGVGLLHFLHVRCLADLRTDLELLVRTFDGGLQRAAVFLAPHEDHFGAFGGVLRFEVGQRELLALIRAVA